ncbi:MAG: uroporphyrinogen-III synthase, partial [Runella zeae]
MSETILMQQDRLNKVASILVTQARPTDEKSPYFELASRYNLKIDFRPFIEIQGIAYKDFRKQRINIMEHTAIIFTSRNAVDHFFRIC